MGAEEIRVCVQRSCRRQGSMETLDILSGISPPNVSVKTGGCLGRCGSGPNLVAIFPSSQPQPQPLIVSHCGTPAHASHLMSHLCGWLPHDASNSLQALSLTTKAQLHLRTSNFNKAHSLLSQAIHLKPAGGIHIIYKDRASARLALGDNCGALEDAKEAVTLAPHYPEAYICQGDIFLSMGQYDAAEKSYAIALELSPSLRRSKSFKARIVELQAKVASVDMPEIV